MNSNRQWSLYKGILSLTASLAVLCLAECFDPRVALGQYVNLHDFVPASDGYGPKGGLLLSNSTLFGTASIGGPGSRGTIWSFEQTTGLFTNLYDFDFMNDGGAPLGGMAMSGTVLFGTNGVGGANDGGTIWSLDTSTGTFDMRHDLAFVDGQRPEGGLAILGNRVFGTARVGGEFGGGTVWSLDMQSNEFAKLHDFAGNDGGQPDGAIAILDSKVIGTTRSGGLNDNGTIWALDTTSGLLSTLHDFNDVTDGSRPEGGVTVSGTTIYGTSRNGGSGGAGTIWSFDNSSSEFTKLFDLSLLQTGGAPTSQVAVIDQLLYGTTETGINNPFGNGTIWSFGLQTGEFTTLDEFDGSDGSFRPTGDVAMTETAFFGTTEGFFTFPPGNIWEFVVPEPTAGMLFLVGVLILGLATTRG